MSLPLALACLWLVAANVAAMFPSRDHHWRFAYLMMAAGLPLLVWVVVADGVIWGAVVLVAAGSVLRWPVWFLWRWVRGRLG